jgi:signal transduction histidine kinase
MSDPALPASSWHDWNEIEMLHEFLDANRAAVVERWRAKVADRRALAPALELAIPQFLGQVIEVLRIDHGSHSTGVKSARLSRQRAQIASIAAQHGRELLSRGFSVEHVVHDYGDLGQAVTEVVGERHTSVAAEELKIVSSCLDEAIADAVGEFGSQREVLLVEKGERAMSERLGFLAHEQRNFLNTAILSFAAIKSGAVAINGATSAVLDRSLIGLRNLIDVALADVRLAAAVAPRPEPISVERFIAELQVAANLEATGKGCVLKVAPVEPRLAIIADKQLLYSATSNLLQNAFKFTHPGTEVNLSVRGSRERVLIEVADHCGGLPSGKEQALFRMFEQHGADRSGLGLGLSISRRAVEACAGSLSVRDQPGVGCVFTIDVPRFEETAPA